MRIEIVAGSGSGPTPLAAFDAAEQEMGLSNSNLLYLSSVIPAGADVAVVNGATTLAGEWGDRVYCVMADNKTSTPGEEIWAGIGWIATEKDGRGLFAEHIGSSRESVERQVRDSLINFAAIRGKTMDARDVHMKVIGTVCQDAPVRALVAAVYQAQGW